MSNYEDINYRDDFARTLLHIAARDNDLKAFIKYHKLGCSLTAYDNSDEMPIHEACHAGSLEIVNYILEQDITLMEERSSYLRTPLHHAAEGKHINVMIYLIEKGACITATDQGSRSALYHLELDFSEYWKTKDREVLLEILRKEM